MTRKQAGSGSTKDGLAESLDHARFIWEAEVENARRLANRTTILITIEAALLGLGAATMGTPRPMILDRVLSGIAALLVLVGLAFLLRPRRRGSESAQSSRLLLGSAGRLRDPKRRSAEQVRHFALERTMNAAIDLGMRNTRRQRDIDRAQVALLIAAAALTSAGLRWLSSPGTA